MAKKARRLGRGLNSLLSPTKGKKGISTIPPAADSEEKGRSRSQEGGEQAWESNETAAPTTEVGVEPDELDPSFRHIGAAPTPFSTDAGGGTRESDGSSDAKMVKADRMLKMACSAIDVNPFQPRMDPEKANLEELADSIRQVGVMQPLTVRPKGNGRFELIAGERRWRASQLAGLTEVPAIVREINDERMLEEALIENIQREDLNAVDRAAAYRRYCDSFKLTVEQVAERVGEKRQTVSNFLRLLELDADIRDLIAHGVLSAGHGKALAGVPDQALRMKLAKSAVARSLSVRALEAMIRDQRQPTSPKAGDRAQATQPGRRADKRAVVADLEDRFTQAVGTQVEIREGKPKGTGKIVVNYYTLDDFDRIAAILGVKLDDEC